MKRFWAVLAPLLAMPMVLVYPDGQTTVPFLTISAEAREAAMGDAYSAEARGSHAVWTNPAGLARSNGPSLTLMHALYLDNISYSTLAAALPFWGEQALGIGIGSLSAGSIPSFDSTGQPASSYSPHDLKARLAYARRIFSLQAGVAATYIHSTIQDSATTETFDFGLQQVFNSLVLALSVENVGGSLTYLNTPEPLPRRYRLGSSYRVTPGWCVTSDLFKPTSGNTTLGVGTEYSFDIGDKNAVAFRAGYNTRDKQGISGLTGMSAGAGFRLSDTVLNYAWVPFGDLGQTHRISVDFELGGSSSREVASSSQGTDLPLQEKSFKKPSRQLVREAAAWPLAPWKVTRSVNRSAQARLMDILSRDALCPATGPKAVITRIQGKVALKKADQMKWVRARLGDYLFESDVLRTGPNSFADLILLNSVKLKLANNSLLAIMLGIPVCEVAHVRLNKGGLRADVAEERHLTVETPFGDEDLSGLQGSISMTDRELATRVTAGTATFTADGQTFPIREKKIFRKVKDEPGLISEDDPHSGDLAVKVAPAGNRSITGRWDQTYVRRVMDAVSHLAVLPDLELNEYIRESGLRSALQANLEELGRTKAELAVRSGTFRQDMDNFRNLMTTLAVPSLSETPEEKKAREKNFRDARKSLARAKASFLEIDKEFKVANKDYRFSEEFLAKVPIVRMLNITALESAIPFSAAQSALSTEVTPALDAIAEVIRQLKPYRVVVEGHTDKSGSDSTNRRLSKQRAAAVVAYLRKKAGEPSSRFMAKGMGSSHPASNGNSADQMAKDRRVEIWLELRGL